MRPIALVLVLAFLSAGCFGSGEGADGSPSPTPSVPPAPKVVYGTKTVDRCGPPSGGQPAPQMVTEPPASFAVDTPYDEILINFHTSGVGKAGLKIASKESGTVVWEKSEDVNTIPSGVPCGGHAHSGNAATKPVPPGNYTVTLSYQGAVAIHADVTLKSTKAAANATHQH